MKIAVIGANGQLGSDIMAIHKKKGHEVIGLNHDKIDITNFDLCRKFLSELLPDHVINTAAMHQVEECEQEPMRAFQTNSLGPRNLAILANELSFALTHISTDYVFNGLKRSPYVESDSPAPLNVYGNTKLSGEMFVSSVAKRYFVVRVSGLYGRSPCRGKGGLNFVNLMLKLSKERDEVRVVDDEVLTPTHTADIAEQLEKLVTTDNYGLYHMTSQGSCSWYQFTRIIFDFCNIKTKLSTAGPGEFPVKVPRPKYSVLKNQALKALGQDIMPHWSNGLERYLKQILAMNP